MYVFDIITIIYVLRLFLCSQVNTRFHTVFIRTIVQIKEVKKPYVLTTGRTASTKSRKFWQKVCLLRLSMAPILTPRSRAVENLKGCSRGALRELGHYSMRALVEAIAVDEGYQRIAAASTILRNAMLTRVRMNIISSRRWLVEWHSLLPGLCSPPVTKGLARLCDPQW